MKQSHVWCVLMMVFCFLVLVVASPAMAGTDIGAPSSGLFAKVGAVLQEFVDFFEGPVGLAVAILGMVFAVGYWTLSTRGDAELGWVGRVVIGAILIINIPGFVIAMKAI
jgi:type IV secretory pathway VirB2 component (pilin)